MKFCFSVAEPQYFDAATGKHFDAASAAPPPTQPTAIQHQLFSNKQK
jgi:hypothetical protein